MNIHTHTYTYMHITNITHNKIQLEQQMSANNEQNCSICNQKISSFINLISHSLYGKYSSSQNFYYTKEVNEILEEAISPAYINFQDDNYYDDTEEYLKRQYKQHQYGKKIQMLSQYYKFHRDLPTWNNRHVDGIMAKYYGRLKDVDYKKIKSVLKKQQGISLTTHKSFSSIDDSQYTKKSRYSTMLNDLQHSNDSIFLRQLCQKIGKAFKKIKVENNFKGTYYSGQKKFQQFLKKQKKRIQNKNQRVSNQNFNLNLKKMKFNPKLNTNTKDEQQTRDIKQIMFPSNHSIKDRKYSAINLNIKNTISVQKTTANETISRQEKTRRDKSKSNINGNGPMTSRTSLSKKKNSTINAIVCDNYKNKIKSKNFNIASIIQNINNQNLKTINEIYRSQNQKSQKKQKINEITRKQSAKQLVSRLRYRSQSQQNLPISSALSRNQSKKKLTNAQKAKTTKISLLKQRDLQIKFSTIELDGNIQKQKALTARQNSHRILRANSSGKLSQHGDKQYTTNKNGGDRDRPFGKKRESAIDQILQKKLAIFKRKQPAL